MAHGLVVEDHAKEMLPVLRQALMTAALLSAWNTAPADPSDRIH